MKPSSFAGGADPIMAENWIQDIEETLAVLPCTDEQKAVFATFKLKREAKPDFRHLVQGQMTVSQYTAQFIELSRFAPHLAPDEEKKARKFKEGLRHNLFEKVIGFWAQTFAEVVHRAAVIESGLQRGITTQSQRKRPTPWGFQASSSRGPWRGDCYRGDQRQTTGPREN
ncbi:uncharacterized protein LOC131163576 [Malania oleifera]|uniref:uncharacterized protein LOC131163576 n=1 Tax=Malania oleifera TaxID=397392 RepID=UPI0025AE67E2|nr:uncharacterized protein LOC131163576 [Malania oleifera]